MKFESIGELCTLHKKPSLELTVDKIDSAFCTMENGLSAKIPNLVLSSSTLNSKSDYYSIINIEHINIEQFKKTIKKVEFYPPATKMTFIDGEVVTVVARHGDDFDEETGVMHCILKRLFKGTGYNTMIRSLIKDAHKREAAEFLKKENEKKAKEAADKAKEEARKKEQKRLAREREEKIEIQKEAYIRAMKEMKGKK